METLYPTHENIIGVFLGSLESNPVAVVEMPDEIMHVFDSLAEAQAWTDANCPQMYGQVAKEWFTYIRSDIVLAKYPAGPGFGDYLRAKYDGVNYIPAGEMKVYEEIQARKVLLSCEAEGNGAERV